MIDLAAVIIMVVTIAVTIMGVMVIMGGVDRQEVIAVYALRRGSVGHIPWDDHGQWRGIRCRGGMLMMWWDGGRDVCV